jgi:hypothetical protein
MTWSRMAAVAVFGVWMLTATLAVAQESDKPAGLEEQRRVEAARLAQETTYKAALAEWIVAREEAASGRAFDAGFRATVKAQLTSRSVADLTARSSGGVTPLNFGDTQADLVYTPVVPCRIIDTRLTGVPLTAGFPRDFVVAGDASAQGGQPNCGIPYGPATAAVINFVAIGPAGPGDLRVTPAGAPLPLASILNYSPLPGLNIANGLVVTMCDPSAGACLSDITILADVSGTDVVADVQGYFRNIRREQIRSFVKTVETGVSLTIGNTCTNYHQITVIAPVAGRVLVRANAIVNISHNAAQTELLYLFIGVSPNDCSLPFGYAAEYQLPAEVPLTTTPYRVTLPVFATFDVGPGSVTYYLNGQMASGQDAQDKFWYAGLEATFFPD